MKKDSEQKKLAYSYFINTWWLNNNTFNGWGATKAPTTMDYLSGYGVKATLSCPKSRKKRYPNILPNGRKLKQIYIYENKKYFDPYCKVIYNNKEYPVYKAPGRIVSCQIVSV